MLFTNGMIKYEDKACKSSTLPQKELIVKHNFSFGID